MTDKLKELQFKFAKDMWDVTKSFEKNQMGAIQYKKERERLTTQYFIDKENIDKVKLEDFFT